jgi:4-amino-4-deoxy-L-arabinose transferase-like glycosyltransferase
MTLFEYISIATSLILSFSLARTLTNLAPIFGPEHRYWVHGAWVLVILANHAHLFWQIWLFQSVEVWTLVEFVLLLMGPIMLLIGASLLVPVGAVPDYRIYFESIRGPFYSVLIVISVQPIPLLYLVSDIPLIHPLHLSSLIFASAGVVGLVGRKRSIDMVLVCFWILGVVGGLFVSNDHEVTRALFTESLRG